MALPFTNQTPVPYFFRLLSTPAGSLPKGAQWVVMFEDLAGNILPGIKLALQYEGYEWKIEEAAKIVTNENYQKTSGCVFCQAIGLPSESMVANLGGDGVNYNGFLRSHVGQGRNQEQSMRVTFLDTNVSFAENFLRPWSISTANFGLIARDGEKQYRTNAHFYKLGSYSSKLPPVVTMKVSFYGICCIGVTAEEYSYEGTSSPTRREATFIYNYYSIDTETGNLFLKSPSTENLANPLGLQNYGQQPVGQSLQAGNPFDKKVSMIPAQLSQEAANQKIQQAGSILSGPQAFTFQ